MVPKSSSPADCSPPPPPAPPPADWAIWNGPSEFVCWQRAAAARIHQEQHEARESQENNILESQENKTISGTVGSLSTLNLQAIGVGRLQHHCWFMGRAADVCHTGPSATRSQLSGSCCQPECRTSGPAASPGPGGSRAHPRQQLDRSSQLRRRLERAAVQQCRWAGQPRQGW